MRDTPHASIRSSWNETRLLMRGPLTDRKIEKYAKAGYYSDAFRQARREAWQRKAAKRAARSGNFLLVDGRMIFSPE